MSRSNGRVFSVVELLLVFVFGVLYSRAGIARAQDAASPAPPPMRSTTAVIEKRWLNLPIKNEAERRDVRIIVDGKVVRRLHAELAADANASDWWGAVDMGPWQGKSATIQITGLPPDARVFEALRQADEPLGREGLYAEQLRPQFHFTAARGRLNDPNGLAYYNGEWHMFFQLAPYSYGSGVKHWGHAVSKDLVHWQDLGIAIHAEDQGAIYSGSGVVDHRNSSGLGDAGRAPLVLCYTLTSEPYVQAIASSTDGRSFAVYPHNPVAASITPLNRDPKVFWHEPTGQWIMALYVQPSVAGTKGSDGRPVTRRVMAFLASSDLKGFRQVGEFAGGMGDDKFLGECPELFSIPVVGRDAGKVKWVIHGGDGQYMLGDFDGKAFVPETGKMASFAGDRYAAQTFDNAPDGRRVQIAWMRGAAFPGMPFNGCMSVPVELSLKATPEGLRLASWPAKELEGLRRARTSLPAGKVRPGENPLSELRGEIFDLEAVIDPRDAKTIAFELPGGTVTYDAAAGTLTCGKFSAPVPLVDGKLRLRVLGDRTILEVFGADGLCYLAAGNCPRRDVPMKLTVSGGDVEIVSLLVHEMNSAWRAPGDSAVAE
ncbi:MAG: glycoside hydrolase family 32 protein [Tepidisphaeraceae bacterium]